jgi:hypothetical protein
MKQEIGMRPAIHTTTRVMPGGRIEVTAPEFVEGQAVEVIVVLPETAGEQPDGIATFLNSLPDRKRDAAYWEEREREFKAERDSWDR